MKQVPIFQSYYIIIPYRVKMLLVMVPRYNFYLPNRYRYIFYKTKLMHSSILLLSRLLCNAYASYISFIPTQLIRSDMSCTHNSPAYLFSNDPDLNSIGRQVVTYGMTHWHLPTCGLLRGNYIWYLNYFIPSGFSTVMSESK